MGIWKKFSNKIVTGWDPVQSFEKKDAIDRIFWVHFLPNDNEVSPRSYSLSYSLYLGTIAAAIFAILCITGLLLMFRYVPSVEHAYWSVKDINFIFPFGWFIRSLHLISAYFMISFVFLHLCRTFYTGAFKKGKRENTNGWLNWLAGVVLLLLTLAMAYTGYLLPWDQVSYWGAVIGTNIIKSIPIIGDELRYFVLGGNAIGQNFLSRIFILHVLLLPFLAMLFISYHFWRNKKDGGMACDDNIESHSDNGSVNSHTLAASKPDTLHDTPLFLQRLIWVFLSTLAFAVLLALFINIPIEAPADPVNAPNPAKAPWFLLWMQELVATTTISIGQYRINGGLVGGVLIPAILLIWLALVPFFDKSPSEATGVWFHRTRLRQNVVFTAIALAIILLIFFAYFCRGPNWDFFWPWEAWPGAH
ncbi:cytochrome b [Desulfotignum phosphitoxidans]|uniref:Cytochrome b of the bc complex n=1 Tax=Desulfotignum phosphitoxidans DSM 13687 TaxID=1286635 RepID=S0FQA0_9BACT|nr:cytochrome bc complex cytochrome b subunit [Desulfotignum phosphitoxidans]EMS77238.1 cytochrome b of the bc complex [Desulfotignum phosphitoxidans DSM 13687]